MKIFTKLFLASMLVTASSMAANADGLLHSIRPVKSSKEITSVKMAAPKSLNKVKRDASGSRVDVLIDEDFNKLTHIAAVVQSVS